MVDEVGIGRRLNKSESPKFMREVLFDILILKITVITVFWCLTKLPPSAASQFQKVRLHVAFIDKFKSQQPCYQTD